MGDGSEAGSSAAPGGEGDERPPVASAARPLPAAPRELRGSGALRRSLRRGLPFVRERRGPGAPLVARGVAPVPPRRGDCGEPRRLIGAAHLLLPLENRGPTPLPAATLGSSSRRAGTTGFRRSRSRAGAAPMSAGRTRTAGLPCAGRKAPRSPPRPSANDTAAFSPRANGRGGREPVGAGGR